jgi:hypothetical protein
MANNPSRSSVQRFIRLLAIGIMMAFVLTACAGSGERDDTSAANGSNTSADTTSADSASAGDRSVGSDLSPQPAPPPGTVEVRALVETCSSGADGMQCQLLVQSVLRSGMSTPVMATGRRTVRVQQHVADAFAGDGLPRETPRDLRLSAPSESLDGASDTSMWTLVRVL